jgi:hypothetical protein
MSRSLFALLRWTNSSATHPRVDNGYTPTLRKFDLRHGLTGHKSEKLSIPIRVRRKKMALPIISAGPDRNIEVTSYSVSFSISKLEQEAEAKADFTRSLKLQRLAEALVELCRRINLRQNARCSVLLESSFSKDYCPSFADRSSD